MDQVKSLWGDNDNDDQHPSVEPASPSDSAASNVRQSKKRPSATSKYFDAPAGESKMETAPLHTLADAYNHCMRLALVQIESAISAKTLPNVSTSGDRFVQTTIQLLLPDALMRRLFLQISSTPRSWPRLSPLFGAPPYYFLQPGDAGGVRAGGFAHARVHMTYDQAGQIPGTAQFEGQFTDEHGRLYKVHLPSTASLEQPLVGGKHSLDVHSVLYVRVKRRTTAKLKNATSRDAKTPFLLPRPGEMLQLTETPQLRRLRHLDQPSQTSVRIISAVPRNHNATSSTGLVRYSIAI